MNGLFDTIYYLIFVCLLAFAGYLIWLIFSKPKPKSRHWVAVPIQDTNDYYFYPMEVNNDTNQCIIRYSVCRRDTVANVVGEGCDYIARFTDDFSYAGVIYQKETL